MKHLLTVLLALGILAGPALAQDPDFMGELQKLASTNAEGYLGPFGTVFGTSMNSGLYHTAKPHSILGFDISLKITGVPVNEEDKTFIFALPSVPVVMPDNSTRSLNGNLIYPDRESSTVFGESESHVMVGTKPGLEAALLESGFTEAEIDQMDSNGQLDRMLSELPQIATPQGTGLPGAGLIMPQVSVGLPFKTEVLVRYAPETEIDKIGKLTFMGIGVKHSISQWIPVPMLGLDISGQYVWQELKIGDVLESKNTALNIQASRRFGLLIMSITPYVGAGIESSTLKVDYVVTGSTNELLPDGTHVTMDLDGKNTGRLTGGLRLGLFGILTINGDYSIGEYKAYSIGLGLTLR